MGSFQQLLPRNTSDAQLSPFTGVRNVEPIPGRRNISRACDSCRERKIKCNGREPACSNCTSSNKTCSYKSADGRSKEHWKSMIENLQQQNEKLEDVIASLRCNSFPQAVERLRQLRGPYAPSSQQRELTVTGSINPPKGDGGSSHSFASSTTSLSRGGSISPVGQPSNLLGNDRGTPSLDAGYSSLPRQLFTHRSLSAYFSCGSTLFYVMPRETCEDLMSSLYEHPASINKSDACALFAVAAMGSQYSAEEIPDVVKETYFQYASLLLKDTAEEDALMGMRACIGLAVYLILLKCTSARTITATGLNIARWNMRRWMRNANHEDRLEWARVLRTLAFIECWLSSTLGYSFDLGREETNLLEELASFDLSTNSSDTIISPSMIQFHIYKIALVSAQVQSQLQLATCLSTHELDRLPTKLDTWHEELPESLQLSSLTTGNSPPAASLRRPLLFMHMVHIGSRIALYERIILLTLSHKSGDSDRTIPHHIFRLAEDIHNIYASFAQQLARIIRLLYEDQSVLSRCWLTIHACFHSSITLLLRAAQNLVRGVCRSSVSVNLSYVHDCLLALDCCNEHDIVAMKFTGVVAPLYQRLCQIADDSEADDTDKSAIRAQLDGIICQLVSAMAIPFKDLWI